MNRPSLYAAFGDKKSMYRATLAAFGDNMRTEVAAALGAPVLEDALRRFYRGAIKLYVSGEEGPRGCLYVCTAAVDAVQDADIRADIARVLHEIDGALTARFEQAKEAGELGVASNPAALAAVAGAVLHSLAIRARAGYTRRQLEKLAATTIELIVASSS